MSARAASLLLNLTALVLLLLIVVVVQGRLDYLLVALALALLTASHLLRRHARRQLYGRVGAGREVP